MKNVTRWICAALALLMILSLLPLTALAAEESYELTLSYICNKKEIKKEKVTVGSQDVTLEPSTYIEIKNQMYRLVGFSDGSSVLTVPAYDGTAEWKEKWSTIKLEYEIHTHKYTFTFDRTKHKRECACGKLFEAEDHLDPAGLTEKVCTCGYRYSDNTDLTTFWFTNCRFPTRFQKGVTEYTGTTVAYYDVTKTNITAFTFDAKALLELPEDTTIKEGLNTFQIKVTAEDRAATTTYTFNIIKPAKVDGIPVIYDGTSVTAEPKTVNRYPKNVTEISDALCRKLLEVASQEGYTQVVLKPNHSFWGNQQIETTIPAVLAAKLAETKADLVVDTQFGTLTIPNAQLAKLAGETDLTVTMVKGKSIQLFQEGTEITEIPQEVVMALK